MATGLANEIIEQIYDYVANSNYPVSTTDVANMFNASTKLAERCLASLSEQGLIQMQLHEKSAPTWRLNVNARRPAEIYYRTSPFDTPTNTMEEDQKDTEEMAQECRRQRSIPDFTPYVETYERKIQNLKDELNKAYSERAKIAQLAVVLARDIQLEAGMRVVGNQDPKWPVFVINLGSEKNVKEVAFHLSADDVIIPEPAKTMPYKRAWRYDQLSKELQKEELEAIYKAEKKIEDQTLREFIVKRETDRV